MQPRRADPIHCQAVLLVGRSNAGGRGLHAAHSFMTMPPRILLWLAGSLVLYATGCDRSPPDETTAAGPGNVDSEQIAEPQWFLDITDQAGLDFVYETGATGALHMPEIMGSGAAMFDYDGDGDLDIYLTNGNFVFAEAQPQTAPVNRLFRQQEDGRFVDATTESGLGDPGYGMGVAVGDIDNDGDLDVYVTNFGEDALYLNRGDGTFADISATAGAATDGWSCSASFLDYDRDGYLDLYITRYLDYDPSLRCFDGAGRPDYCGPKSFPPTHDVLLHNNGDPNAPGFTDVSEQAGISTVAAAGLGVVCEDLNDDDWIDVYVANDGYANHLWLNQADGTFVEAGMETGSAFNMQGSPEAGMGIVAADFNNDSSADLFLTHLANESNTLYVNRGGSGGFEDASAASGLGTPSVPYTGFGNAAFDAELDGDIDVFIVNGRVARTDPRPDAGVGSPWDRYAEPNLFSINGGDGRFARETTGARAICDGVEISRGLATGDIDGDGLVDLLVSNIESPARLYRNQAPREGRWLSVRAVDPRLARDAIGARVNVVVGEHLRWRTISAGGGYLSSSDFRAHFGLGDSDHIDRIEVRWPDGLRETFMIDGVDRAVVLRRGEGRVDQ